jgi:hypothetical protein
MEWSTSEDHSYSGLVDPDRIGLAGHSHGSALLTMQHLGPMSSISEHTIQAVSLLAPCPDEAIEDYVDVYGGMQPLQVIYGSRDQDGCVAYGQSIAIIEAGGAPSHFVHLDGGSHYGFTDAGGLLDATITRTDHQDMALASWLAWWKYHLEGDTSALPYLRGDRAFFDSGPEYRSQFIEALPLVVDAFNPPTDPEPTWIEVPAITGIEGQTYINGFLSDTFVDIDAGKDIIRAEITDLITTDGPTDGPASVLFFVDYALGTEAYGLALDELETIGLIAVTQAFSHSEFATLIPEDDGWDLVISATQTGSAADENESDEPLAAYICSGGRAIVSDYRMHSDGAASVLACSLTGFDELTNYDNIVSDGSLFSEPIDLYNPGWGFFTVGLSTEGATVFAHTLAEGPPSVSDSLNAFGFPLETEGLDGAFVGWMHDESRGLYHPNWGLELSWTTAGGWVQQRLSDSDGVDLSDTPVLSFRLLQIEGDPLNPAETTHDYHIRLTDAHGTTATIALSDAPQGVLRANPAVGTGTPAKAVYETYRLALERFTSAEESIDITQIESVAWVFDINETGALIMDDVVFTRAGRCE